MSWMRPRPQFCVSGRVNRPHFEHSVTMLRSFLRRGSGLGKLARISSGSPRVDQPSSTHLSVSSWVTMFTSFLLADVIGEEMAARPDPLDMAGRFEHLLRHIAAVQQRTPYHLTGVGRVVGAIERLADDRAHAVGGDHILGLDLRAIGEGEHDAVVLLLDPGQAVPEMNGAVIEPACERVQQVGAVKAVIGRAVPFAAALSRSLNSRNSPVCMLRV